ncbi:MAG: hypothetical protein GC162_03365 [Planctomycetes bacterium]|nr:hypothetical protein [Planctomycetota bacterium]
MNPTRLKKLILVTAISLLGVGAIILISDSVDTSTQKKDTAVNIKATDLPPTLEHATPGVKPTIGALGTGEGAWIQRTDPQTGQLKQEFFYKSLTPREQGVFDITEPQARLYLAPWRVIHMTSEEGRFIAPDNHPQSGVFRKNLVLTVFQAPETRAADLSPDSKDRLIEIHIADQATFDTVLGEVKSDSDLTVTTPQSQQVEFAGRGMKLVYNELNRRIEYMEVYEGKSLRYDPRAGPAPIKGATPAKTPPGGATQPADATAAKAHPMQYYRVTFDKNVKVVSDDRTIEADRLVVFFTMDPSGSAPAAAPASPQTPVSMMMREVMRTLPLLIGEVGQAPLINVPAGKAVQVNVDKPAGDKPVVMTWTGKMIMTPIETKPAELAEGLRDTYLRFEGAPVKVGLGGDDQMVCFNVDYVQSRDQVTATGSDAFPLRIRSKKMGEIGAPSLNIQLAAGTGRIAGPGWMRGPEATEGATKTVAADGALPPGFKIDWADHVELKFTKEDKKTGSRGGLELAKFHGDVHVADPQFKLAAQTLGTEFTRADAAGKQQIQAIDADGNVMVTLDNGSIKSRTLRILTAPDAQGHLTPSRLQARGDVVVIDPQQQIASQILDVTLAAAAPNVKPAPKPAPKGDSLEGRFSQRVENVTAIEDVRLTLKGGTVVRGDKLVADATTQRATLYGTPVQITRGGDAATKTPPQTELYVLHLNIEKGGRIAQADGAGKFIYTEADETDPATKQLTPGKRVKVTWTELMRFVDEANTIAVNGSVVAETEESPTEFNRMTADHVTLDLINTSSLKVGPKDKSADAGPLDERRLRQMTARDNVVILATRWSDAQREHVDTRLRLAGPILEFEDLRKITTITGPGTMLLEDYREKKDKPTDLKAAPMSGRGQTAFQWTQKLVLNETDKSMTIEGAVLMRHKSPGSDNVLELQADRLVANMREVRNIKPTQMPVEKMGVDHIAADGGVQVRDNTRVASCDHLYYDGDSETVALAAEADRWVTITKLDDPKPLRARKVLWNLKTDRVEIIEAGR